MSRDRTLNALIQGIIAADTVTKQELGRRFAFCLGLTLGSAGADGGIDGYGSINNRKIYFQSKLKGHNVGAEEAGNFYSSLIRYEADIGIMLVGVGYTSPTMSHPQAGFKNRLLEFPDIDRYRIHLLSLRDIFEETPEFEEAVRDLPPMRELTREAWKDYD